MTNHKATFDHVTTVPEATFILHHLQPPLAALCVARTVLRDAELQTTLHFTYVLLPQGSNAGLFNLDKQCGKLPLRSDQLVLRVQEGKANSEDDPRPARPLTAVTEENVDAVERLIDQ
ncbi:hypothetical protein, partial [Neptuniibacter sp.]|uniref:hypothetical protein n=1 Tax=Neptuniibacter sp. TaxID=1962643 RepID=UPI002621FBCF